MQIAAFLGIDAPSKHALRKKLRGYIQHESMPVKRLRGRVFAEARALRAWWRNL